MLVLWGAPARGQLPQAPAVGKSLLLAGDSKAVWAAVRNVDDDKWRLSVRTMTADRWDKPLAQQFEGLTALAASGDSAVLFFARSDLMVMYPQQESGHRAVVKAPPAMWGLRSGPLAVCPAGDGVILTLVERTRAPASRPTPPTAGTTPPQLPMELAVLRYHAGESWSELAVLPIRKGVRSGLLAFRGGVVYVLVVGAETSLHALEADRWRPMELPPDLGSDEPLALTAMREGVVLTSFEAETRGAKIFLLAGNKWVSGQTVRSGADPATWDEGGPPIVSRFGGKLAFAWREKTDLFFGRCDLAGDLTREPLAVFEQPPPKIPVARIEQVATWVIFGVLFALIFWPKQTLRTRPFSLPEALVPAPAGRRLLAFAIDILPVSTVVSWLVVGGQEQWTEAMEQLLEKGRSDELALAVLISLAVYAAYCIFMEYRFGATLGKRIMKLCVVGDGGRKPTLREVALRNVAKIPEVLFSPLLIFALLTRYRQRLGDKMAWTAVIDVTASLATPPPQESPEPEQADDRADDEEKL